MSSIDDAVEPRDVIASVIDTAQEVAAVDAPIDLKEAGLSQRDALLKLSDEVKPWRSLEGEAFASIQVDGHTEHHAVKSHTFRNLMRHRVACRFTQGGRPAAVNENLMRDALSFVEARAMHTGATYPAALRSTEHDGERSPRWHSVLLTQFVVICSSRLETTAISLPPQSRIAFCLSTICPALAPILPTACAD